MSVTLQLVQPQPAVVRATATVGCRPLPHQWSGSEETRLPPWASPRRTFNAKRSRNAVSITYELPTPSRDGRWCNFSPFPGYQWISGPMNGPMWFSRRRWLIDLSAATGDSGFGTDGLFDGATSFRDLCRPRLQVGRSFQRDEISARRDNCIGFCRCDSLHRSGPSSMLLRFKINRCCRHER